MGNGLTPCTSIETQRRIIIKISILNFVRPCPRTAPQTIDHAWVSVQIQQLILVDEELN